MMTEYIVVNYCNCQYFCRKKVYSNYESLDLIFVLRSRNTFKHLYLLCGNANVYMDDSILVSWSSIVEALLSAVRPEITRVFGTQQWTGTTAPHVAGWFSPLTRSLHSSRLWDSSWRSLASPGGQLFVYGLCLPARNSLGDDHSGSNELLIKLPFSWTVHLCGCYPARHERLDATPRFRSTHYLLSFRK